MLMWHSSVHTTAKKYKIMKIKRTARAGHLISAFLKKKNKEQKTAKHGKTQMLSPALSGRQMM